MVHRLLSISLLGLTIASSSLADETAFEAWQADPSVILQAKDADLEQFKWKARPVIVFAESPLDTAFETQLEYFAARIDEVTERDIVVLVDTDPNTPTDLREKLRPRGFMLVLIGKDGSVKLRKPFPWDMRELGRVIDKMPMRQREISERRAERAAQTVAEQ